MSLTQKPKQYTKAQVLVMTLGRGPRPYSWLLAQAEHNGITERELLEAGYSLSVMRFQQEGEFWWSFQSLNPYAGRNLSRELAEIKTAAV